MSVNQPDDLNTEFEESLTQALRPVDAPEGFADRVVARSQSAPGVAKVIRMPVRTRAWASGAIAAMLFAGVFFGGQAHVRHERQKAELAQQQFDAAMRITDQTLDHVRAQLQQAGVSMGD
jgi:hypothetical protein